MPAPFAGAHGKSTISSRSTQPCVCQARLTLNAAYNPNPHRLQINGNVFL
jgi:hypothetical protein